MQRPLTPEFTFAGFTFPRYVATLAIGIPALRRQRELRKVCGGYFHAPRPNDNRGRGFYLGDAGMPCERWEWASDTEWYCDEFGDQTMRGLILRLPHGRFLAGYSMGEGMSSAVSATVYTDEDEARAAADEEARCVAESEREYQESERARLDEEEREAALNSED